MGIVGLSYEEVISLNTQLIFINRNHIRKYKLFGTSEKVYFERIGLLIHSGLATVAVQV